MKACVMILHQALKPNIRKSRCYKISNCCFCGHTDTGADVNHFHGSTASVCISTFERRVNCKSDWQNFRIRVKKYKNSKYTEVKAFAYLVEKKVLVEKEPALEWNRQLISIRKIAKIFPMIPEINS